MILIQSLHNPYIDCAGYRDTLHGSIPASVKGDRPNRLYMACLPGSFPCLSGAGLPSQRESGRTSIKPKPPGALAKVGCRIRESVHEFSCRGTRAKFPGEPFQPRMFKSQLYKCCCQHTSQQRGFFYPPSPRRGSGGMDHTPEGNQCVLQAWTKHLTRLQVAPQSSTGQLACFFPLDLDETNTGLCGLCLFRSDAWQRHEAFIQRLAPQLPSSPAPGHEVLRGEWHRAEQSGHPAGCVHFLRGTPWEHGSPDGLVGQTTDIGTVVGLNRAVKLRLGTGVLDNQALRSYE